MRNLLAISMVAFAVLTLTGPIGPALAQQSRELQQCINGDDDARLSGCAQVLNKGNRESAQNRVVAYNNRGLALNNKGEYDRAIRDFDEAIRLDPRYVHAYSNRGWALNNKGEFDLAMRDLDQAIRLDS